MGYHMVGGQGPLDRQDCGMQKFVEQSIYLAIFSWCGFQRLTKFSSNLIYKIVICLLACKEYIFFS
jgi:hypothetical protein